MPAKPTTIDEFLAAVRPDQRAVLQKLRQTIQAAAPEAEEGINYGIAAFRIDGKSIAGFAAAAKHCTFFPMSGDTIAKHAADLKGFDTSKGAVRFTVEKPLPAALVRKLVKSRIADVKAAKAKPAKRPVQPKNDGATKDSALAEFLQKLDHPLKKEIETIRTVILAVSPSIEEGIKWNSLSFRTSDWFATVNLRSRERLQFVFHTGAKKKASAVTGVHVADPKGLVEWLAKDRCLVTLGGAKEIKSNRAAFAAIVKQWIEQM